MLRGSNLLKLQRNELAQIIERCGMEVQGFELVSEPHLQLDWTPVVNGGKYYANSFKIVHKSTGFYYHFDRADSGKYYNMYWPKTKEGERGSAISMNWENILKSFSNWVEVVQQEVSAPDIWEMPRAIFEGVTDFESYDNAPLPIEAQKLINARVQKARSRLLDIPDLSSRQADEINKRLDYLIDATSRLGKTDWKNVAISTFFSLATALSVDTQTGREILRIIKDIFQGDILPIIQSLPT